MKPCSRVDCGFFASQRYKHFNAEVLRTVQCGANTLIGIDIVRTVEFESSSPLMSVRRGFILLLRMPNCRLVGAQYTLYGYDSKEEEPTTNGSYRGLDKDFANVGQRDDRCQLARSLR